MPNVSSFGAQTDNAVVSGTVTDRQMIIPEVPPQGLMSVGPRQTYNFIKEPWNAQTSYVFYDAVKGGKGSTYIATKPVVPAGTPLTDEDYWFKASDPNAQLNELQEIVKLYDGRITENSNAIIAAGTYKSIEAAKLVNDGVTDNSAAFSALQGNVGLKEGIYKIEKDTVINASITFANGAFLEISKNANVTINGSILAGAYEIFRGDGTVNISGFIHPEWFGAKNDLVTDCAPAFNKMMRSILNSAIIVLQPGENNTQIVNQTKGYMFEAPVKIDHSRVSIYGNYATLIFNAQKGFVINSNPAKYNEENQIFNLSIFASEGSNELVAIDASNTVRCTIEKVEIYSTVKGVVASNTSNLVLNSVYYYAQTNQNQNNCIGFHFTGVNASLRMCESHATDLSVEEKRLIGLEFAGISNKDFIIDSCEFNNALIGIKMGKQGVVSKENFDCFISNTVFDKDTRCIKLEGMGSSSKITISNCWLLGDEKSETLMEINSCEGIVVNNCQFTALNAPDVNSSACIINNGHSILISGNTVTNCGAGFKTGNGGSGISFANNVFCQDSNVPGGHAPQYKVAIQSDADGIIIIGNISKKSNSKYEIGIDTRMATAENAIVAGNAIACNVNNLGSANNQFNLTL